MNSKNETFLKNKIKKLGMKKFDEWCGACKMMHGGCK